MKVALVVQGRFHAFDLARELVRRGHDVSLFTNYPRWAVERFDVPGVRVYGFWLQGLLSRVNDRLPAQGLVSAREAYLHRLFGSWARDELAKQSWDVVHLWSGVAEEALRELADTPTTTLLMRGSAHIRTQDRLLREEETRVGVPLERPSRWMIAREEREYALADTVVVLSTFAYNTFVAEGVPADRLRLLPLGARLSTFRPAPEVVVARRRRIVSGARLRVLYVGALSLRKGLWDLSTVVRSLGGADFEFQLVGPQATGAAAVVADLSGRSRVSPKVPQAELPDVYAWGDVFLYPTIEDGYGLVLAQAAAAGLPIVTTPNCSGADLVRDGETGWIVPIRAPDRLIERLRWCAAHREELAALVERLDVQFQPRDWAAVAVDFEEQCAALASGGRVAPAAAERVGSALRGRLF
jgi:glycosyltransferase involved in cell wall biosynthesis